MIRRTLPLLLLCAACGGTQGADYGSQGQPIIGGSACMDGQYPQTVAIIANLTLSANGRQITIPQVSCTGTLIAPDVVLSAGHCIDYNVYSEDIALQGAEAGVNITLDSIDFYISYEGDLTSLEEATSPTMLPQLPSDAVHVIKYIANPDYSLPSATGSGLQDLHDLSLLFLEKAQKAQPAIVIASDESKQVVVKAPVDIVGWGQSTPSAMPEPGTVGKKMCATSFINELGDSEMQIGGDSSTPRKCHGDSGGPSFLTLQTNLTNKVRLVGVTSHAYDSSDCEKGGVDTRVDAYLTWIDQTLQTECSNKTRVWCDVPGLIPPSYYEPKSGHGCSSAEGSLVALLPLLFAGLRPRRRR